MWEVHFQEDHALTFFSSSCCGVLEYDSTRHRSRVLVSLGRDNIVRSILFLLVAAGSRTSIGPHEENINITIWYGIV
jgi:hypothetical protein